MSQSFSTAAYQVLLNEAIPKVIETEEEYDRALKLVEKLLFNKNRTSEETELYKLLTLLVEEYEKRVHPMPDSTPAEMLEHLMEARNLKQSDLVGILGSSGVVSEVVNGKRAISKTQAKALGNLFHVSPALFI
jgi:HTH-type transcriptional regulator/antitoxin HigA